MLKASASGSPAPPTPWYLRASVALQERRDVLAHIQCLSRASLWARPWAMSFYLSSSWERLMQSPTIQVKVHAVLWSETRTFLKVIWLEEDRFEACSVQPESFGSSKSPKSPSPQLSLGQLLVTLPFTMSALLHPFFLTSFPSSCPSVPSSSLSSFPLFLHSL